MTFRSIRQNKRPLRSSQGDEGICRPPFSTFTANRNWNLKLCYVGMKTFHYYRRPGARIRTALQAKSLISTHFLALKTTFIIASHLMRISTFLDHKLLLSIMGYCLGQITIAMVQWSATDRRISVDRRRVATVTTFTGTNQRNHHSSCVLQSAYSLELADCNSHRYLKPPPPPPKPPPNIKRT